MQRRSPLVFAAFRLLLAGLAGCLDSSTEPGPALGDGFFALASDDLDACVADHVAAAGGNRAAVTALECGALNSTCSARPDLSLLLEGFTSLASLDLTGRCIEDVAPIAALGTLTRLELASNRIANIEPLGALTRLEYLGLSKNPLRESWGFGSRVPFASFTALEELDLDDTPLQVIRPLGGLRSLRRLSLRNTSPTTLRPLESLTQLESLHIDGAFIADLEPLSSMFSLEELTLENNFVTSVEPLRGLAEAGRLRLVSLARNCVESCDAIAAIGVDCSQQETGCPTEPEQGLDVSLSGPLPQVEKYAPQLTPWTHEELTNGFAAVRDADGIDWLHARNGCDERAQAATCLLQSLGFGPTTVTFAFGNLRALSKNDPAGYVAFNYHVAVAVYAADAGGVPAWFVLDPALDDVEPLPLQSWYRRLIDSKESALDFSCQRYNETGSKDPSNPCPSDLDENGDLVVDDVEQLTAVVRQDYSCLN
jgi:hypothetical protein